MIKQNKMIIYNVTTKVDGSIKSDWLAWMQEVHIPEVLKTDCFTDIVILQLLEVDNTEGPTYAIQYHAESKALYNRYIDKFANGMLQKAFDKWGNKFISFRSVMQVVN